MKIPETRKLELLAALIAICTLTAAVILIIDYQIKGAIIGQATRTREAVENWEREHGRGNAQPDYLRNNRNGSGHRDLPGDLVYSRDARLEKGAAKAAAPATDPSIRWANVTPENGNPEIPGGN